MSAKLWDPFAQFQKNVLPNGLAVYSLFQDRPFLKVFFVIHSGGLTDQDNKPGRAHFAEHLLCANVPDLTTDDIKKFFKGYVSLGMTYDSSIRYGFTIPADRIILKKALDIFGTMLLPGKIDKFIERERSVIRQEFFDEHRSTTNYEKYVLRKRLALYGNFPGMLFEGILGTPDSIDAINQTDIQSFCDKHLVPQNISIVIVGGLKLEEEDIISGNFGQYRKGGRNQPLEKFAIVPPPTETLHHIRVSDIIKDTAMLDENALYESLVVLPGTVEQKLVILATKILSHQLHQQIRQKFGNNYDFSASYDKFNGIYQLQFYGQVHSSIVNQVEGFVQQCIESAGIDGAIFERMREEGLNEYRLFDPNIAKIAKYAASDIADKDRVATLQEEFDILENARLEDIRKLMDQIFPIERRWTYLRTP